MHSCQDRAAGCAFFRVCASSSVRRAASRPLRGRARAQPFCGSEARALAGALSPCMPAGPARLIDRRRCQTGSRGSFGVGVLGKGQSARPLGRVDLFRGATEMKASPSAATPVVGIVNRARPIFRSLCIACSAAIHARFLHCAGILLPAHLRGSWALCIARQVQRSSPSRSVVRATSTVSNSVPNAARKLPSGSLSTCRKQGLGPSHGALMCSNTSVAGQFSLHGSPWSIMSPLRDRSYYYR
jgi:hypothetical protein